ncbi:MAG: MFS transporter [Kiritimatiellaeota bacterium]|nr:MFS transporter [Kiritimatiellota bacterium]
MLRGAGGAIVHRTTLLRYLAGVGRPDGGERHQRGANGISDMTMKASRGRGRPGRYPSGFRARRGLNWGCIGLSYASFYFCRYNLSFANKSICEEFGFTKDQFGWVLTAFFWAYAVGQMLNGLITDRIGGKRALAIGACSTVLMNALFGLASFWGLLSVFILIWLVNGYLQAFGAPGMIKTNTAWFSQTERGKFAGIFGFMIQLGRFAITKVAPLLLIGFTFLWWTVPPLHWRYVFWIPAAVTVCITLLMLLVVKNTPEEAGYENVHPGETDHAEDERASLAHSFKVIFSNRYVWIVAGAYACTGVVRQGIDQWFPRYMQEVHHVALTSPEFAWAAYGIPLVAVLGALTSGFISDTLFQGRRAPVAAILYFMETAIILLATRVHSLTAVTIFLILISFTVNATHSILGTAAAMDIGGRRMAGTASGVIDSFQYYGGGFAGFLLGWLLEKYGWGSWLISLAGFGIIGGVLMLTIAKRTSLRAEET